MFILSPSSKAVHHVRIPCKRMHLLVYKRGNIPISNSFLQESLLGLLEKMKQGCITEADIRVDLQTRFPDWNIQTSTLIEKEEVINDSICT